jgi:three-Cys-motif partner protein
MSDEHPTLWDAEPHTLAKHGILKSYLDAWTAILSHATRSPELLFVDGFAGPGEYTSGEAGSPIVALNSVLNHTGNLPKPVRFVFIENRSDRYEHLRARLAKESQRIAGNARVILDDPIHGDCAIEIRRLINKRRSEAQPLGPALFFLDQFGYSQVPMTLLQEIMQHRECEAFSYLNCQRMNHFLADQTKWAGITEAYGDDSWKPALTMSGDARQEFLIDAYKNAIRKNAGVTYVWSFAMFSETAQLIHWLIFSTNHVRGLEEMKRAMWKADRAGEYRFSDRVGSSPQNTFFSMLRDDWLADELARNLSGRSLSEADLKEFVLTQTPFYLYKKAVAILLKSHRASLVYPGSQWPIRFAALP